MNTCRSSTCQTSKRTASARRTAAICYQGHLWALPVDAAAQVSVAHADVLRERGAAAPRTWDDVMQFASACGGVTLPLSPINALSCSLTLCAQDGAPVEWSVDGMLLQPDAAGAALDRMRALADMAGPDSLNANPLAILNRMATRDDILYVPLCCGYTN